MERSYEKYFRQNRLPHLWCPGCGNGIAMKAIVEAIAARDEAGAEAALRRHISMAYETRLKEDARLNDEGGA